MRVFETAGTLKCAVILLALTARAAFADGAACDARTPAELRTVFAVAVGLNDALRRTTSGRETPQYQELHAKLAEYDERRTLPCAAAAVELLRTTPDGLLSQSLLGLASSRARSKTRIPSQSLARFLAARPDDFLNALGAMPMADRCGLVEAVESGWPATNPLLAAAPAVAADGLVAHLKRAYCRAASPKPAIEAPSNRTRNRSDPERRPSRPRLARAATDECMTPVAKRA